MTKEEQRRIEAKISTKDDMVNLGIWLGLYTGLRIGELCALKWKDVLFESRCIRISKTLQRILCPDAKMAKRQESSSIRLKAKVQIASYRFLIFCSISFLRIAVILKLMC